MSKSVTVKLRTIGSKNTGPFNVTDNLGNVLGTNVPLTSLGVGVTYTVVDAASSISINSVDVCNNSIVVPIQFLTAQEINNTQMRFADTGNLWRHLTDTKLYNKYYGKIEPYIIEYPFAYQFQDEILQSVKDFTVAYKYLPIPDGVFNDNAKIQTDNIYFNKAIVYNGQQCSGLLLLVPKPERNLAAYNAYPQYYSYGKAILVTKSDSFYQYNTFWNVVKNKSLPLFNTSCESLSIDKVLDQTNMEYTNISFRKSPLRAKGLLIRHILDDKSDAHLVSQFIIASSQISYK